ncbi:hypothetical protein [Pengzhenrongella sp.]|jgi:hypothetical protein|uniref:hypothetical protein n=1 Tax=Pengzhenrongella sp. TaxID=2888820 RepID=UPI002F92F329
MAGDVVFASAGRRDELRRMTPAELSEHDDHVQGVEPAISSAPRSSRRQELTRASRRYDRACFWRAWAVEDEVERSIAPLRSANVSLAHGMSEFELERETVVPLSGM